MTFKNASVNLATPIASLRSNVFGISLDSRELLAGIFLKKNEEDEGLSQDNGLSVSFDANSAALVIDTPLRNYQKMSAKVRFVLDKPQKTFHLVVKKNQHQMELDGRAEAGEAELKLATTLAGLESAMAAGRYDLSSRKTLSLKLSLNDKTVQVGGSLEGLKISIKATDYRKIQLNGDVQLTAQTSTLPLDVGNGRKAFPSHRIAHWPQIGRPDQHALHRIGNDGHERPLERTPVAGPSHVPC